MGCGVSRDGIKLAAEDKDIIRKTWAQFKARGVVDGGIYLILDLIQKEPEARQLFTFIPGNMQLSHGALLSNNCVHSHVINMFNYVENMVENLDNIHSLTPELKALGEKHVGFGVTRLQMNRMGNSLIFALQKQLAYSMTQEAVVAWSKLYAAMCNALVSGMAAARE